VYTKISAIFLLPVAALMVLTARWKTTWGNRHTWAVTLLIIAGLVPVVVLTLRFGQANITSVIGIPDAEVSRHSLAGWVWYARQLPEQIGWPALTFAIIC